jgi:hypothetical protein
MAMKTRCHGACGRSETAGSVGLRGIDHGEFAVVRISLGFAQQMDGLLRSIYVS